MRPLRQDWLDKIASDARRESEDFPDCEDRVAYLTWVWGQVQSPEDVATMVSTYRAAHAEARRMIG